MILDIKKNKIEGLEFLNNKLVKDSRGFIGEIIPGGMFNKFLDGKLGHIYTSIATGKHIARGGHYHFKNIDRFSTISGTALWIFIDYRNKEKKSYSVILGSKEFKNDLGIDNYTIDNDYMLTVKVPEEVYHLFIPLTDENVTVLSLASEKHDDDDYVRISPFDISEIKNLLNNFGIKG